LDEISGIAAGDDAPTCYREWIELAALGLGCRRTGANRLAGSMFGAVTKQLFG
jgi:hypothetical protein